MPSRPIGLEDRGDMPDRLRHRKGFTLAEVAIAAVIIAIIAAVTAPSLVNFIDKQRAQTTANTLSAIATGIAAFETAVTTGGGATNTYPERISYLTNGLVRNGGFPGLE